jgi:hypothetical protein
MEKPPGWGKVPIEPHGLEHFKMLYPAVGGCSHREHVNVHTEFCRMFKTAISEGEGAQLRIEGNVASDGERYKYGSHIKDETSVVITFDLDKFPDLYESGFSSFDPNNFHHVNNKLRHHTERLVMLNDLICREGWDWPLAVRVEYIPTWSIDRLRVIKREYRIDFYDP